MRHFGKREVYTGRRVEDLHLMEFAYHVLTRMPGESYRRRFRSLVLCCMRSPLLLSFVCLFVCLFCFVLFCFLHRRFGPRSVLERNLFCRIIKTFFSRPLTKKQKHKTLYMLRGDMLRLIFYNNNTIITDNSYKRYSLTSFKVTVLYEQIMNRNFIYVHFNKHNL